MASSEEEWQSFIRLKTLYESACITFPLAYVLVTKSSKRDTFCRN